MQRLASFLPFSQRSPSPVFRPPSTQLRESYELLISNEPLDGEAPFTIVTSKPNLLSTSPENARLHFQNVCLSIPGHFLKADLRLTVDAPTQTVTEFHLEGVSSWAEPELAQWLRTPSETRGAAVLGRAFGRYWEAARLRALCWFNCTRDFENLIAKADAPQSSILSRQQIVFSHASVTLKITWRIVINDDGQVKNEASAHTVFPDVWQQGEWSALAKIGNAFDLLVLQKGVDEAVRTVCNLMFPH